MKYFWFNSPTQLLILRTDGATGDSSLSLWGHRGGVSSDMGGVPGGSRGTYQGQWWSMRRTQRWQTRQWWARGGRYASQRLQTVHSSGLWGWGGSAQPPPNPKHPPKSPPLPPNRGLTCSVLRGGALRRSEKSMAVPGRGTVPGGGGVGGS